VKGADKVYVESVSTDIAGAERGAHHTGLTSIHVPNNNNASPDAQKSTQNTNNDTLLHVPHAFTAMPAAAGRSTE
jgi:hypothetical protein